ncbi:DUF6907 domain-containing protein [Streptomyces sp. P9-A2]|uniref:DUF6907 domain-containing protein n=1 Tax=Streptomyces sp. P9-A2 TaxID=3072284 RepID=UPI002FC73D5B
MDTVIPQPVPAAATACPTWCDWDHTATHQDDSPHMLLGPGIAAPRRAGKPGWLELLTTLTCDRSDEEPDAQPYVMLEATRAEEAEVTSREQLRQLIHELRQMADELQKWEHHLPDTPAAHSQA